MAKAVERVAGEKFVRLKMESEDEEWHDQEEKEEEEEEEDHEETLAHV